MPDQPENRTDELLKAYARKRRGEAENSGSWTLEPATRRRLHAEVSHHYRAGKPQDSTGSWWHAAFLLWPRIGVAFGLFLGLGLLIWSYLRQPGQPVEMAKNAPSSNSSEDLVRQPTPVVRSERFGRNIEQDQKGRREPEPLSASRSVVVPALTARAAPSALPPPPAEVPLNKKEARPEIELSFSKALVQTPPGITNPESARGGSKQMLFTSVPQAASQAVSGKDFERFNFRGVFQASEPGSNVLDRFKVEQTRNRLRIIDADGSVYEGAWVTASPSTLSDGSDYGIERSPTARFRRVSPPPTFTNTPQTLPLASPEKSAPQTLAGDSENLARSSVLPERRFTVSGTNRTLNQPVQFSGVMLLFPTNEDVKAGTVAKLGIQSAPSRKLGQDLMLNEAVSSSTSSTNVPWTIQGTAKLGETMRWEIRANQVRPER